MKKSTKRFCLKLAAGFLSTTLVASIALPINVLATTVDVTESLSENTTINSSSPDYSDNIIREVEEERDEFSKTFLMTDGTYYTYVSPIAIHKFVEDKWIDIDDSLSETPATISEAESTVMEYVEEAKSTKKQRTTFDFNTQTPAITITPIGNSTQTETGYALSANSALVIKPVKVQKYSMYNKVLLSATLTTRIDSNAINNNRPLYIKHVTSDVTSSTTYADINAYSNIYYKRYDKTQENYTFDITDIYSKWERGNVVNNGVALVGSGLKGAALQISTPVLSIQYKDVAANDASFTYHTLDLGRAGTLSINDITNAYNLEQTIAGLDCSVLPVSLTKTINSTKFSLNSYANVSSEWNYNYLLSIAGTHATITLPQGTKIEFKQPVNAETINNYQIWEQETNKDYVDDIILHIKDTAINSNSLTGCYFEINGIEYYSNSLGRIVSIRKADKQLQIEYTYFANLDQFVITKLADAQGNQYKISYSTYNINGVDYIYANKIEVQDANDVPVMFNDNPLVVNISNTVENSMITSMFTYPSETEEPINVAYVYDLNGKLLNIKSADGTITELHYKSEDNTYLTGYTQKKNNNVINTFTITSDNTYERIFEGTLIQKEILRYDSDFQLVTYHYGDNIVSMTYDAGSIDSYAVNNLGYNESQNLLDNGDFELLLGESKWFPYSTAYPEYREEYKDVQIKNENANAQVGISQYIGNDGEENYKTLLADTTYVFSADVTVLNSIPSDDYAFNAIIELYLPSNPEIPFDTIKLPFDVSLLNEVQTRMCSFKNDIECEAMISIYADGNVGEFIVDNIRIYKATPEDGAIAIPGVSTSDPIATTITDIGQIKRELITDGTNYMLQEYDYTSDCAKAIGVNDFNGISTYFDYTGRTEILSEKGYAIDSRNLIVDPIVYDYNRAGLLQYVSQTVNSVTGEEIELLTEYTYDSSERITSVSNNNYCYNFTYDDIGNITNINKETVASETPETNNLIDYTYANNNIGIITYSNGYKLEYSYNENGEITNITGYKLNANDSYDVVGSYTYTYSNGRIAETVISSCDLSHDVKIKTTDTSIAIYYLQGNTELVVYSKEKRNSNTVETFISSVSGSNEYETLTKTPITEITVGTTTELYSEFHSEKRSLLDSGLLVATDGSNNVVTDYFGRIVSKYSTLEANAVGSTSADSLLLGLTNNYTYKELTPVEDIPGIRTSNLIESITNEINITKTSGNTTTNDLSGFAYNYVYDNRGNIRFVFRFSSDGDSYMEGYYQYDEANQVTATFGPLGCEFYVYDNNGNIVEKMLSEDVAISGIDETALYILENVTYENWNSMDWSSLSGMHITPVEPEFIQYFDYDDLGRIVAYEEKSFSYDADGNVTEETVENSFEIPYDSYGNPLKYVGKNTVYETIVADLSWNGNLLASAIIHSGSTPKQKLTFAYDENGFRINKTIYDYSSSINAFVETQKINYVWENGQLSNMQLALIDEGSEQYMYTNILYDNMGSPCGIITPMGVPYYFLKDSSDNVRGLVNTEGETIAEFMYDAFGSLYTDIKGDTFVDELFNTITAMYNPCTYKGYLYDYELGTYFIQNKCYSPTWCRALNEVELETLTDPSNEPLKSNLHLICNNNLVNSYDVNAEWDRSKFTFTSDRSHGIQVEMSNAFLSRPFCTLYASKILSETGSWDYLNGRNLKNMGIERIASNLFARCVGNYAESAVNRVNATWGDGWIVSNRNSAKIIITELDSNADKYMKIWLAAPSIKSFATAHGIYITL